MRMLQIKETEGRLYRYPLAWLALQIIDETPAKGKKKSSCSMKLRFIEPTLLLPGEKPGEPLKRYVIEPEFWFETAAQALAAYQPTEIRA